jgi:hypothetical protein
MSVERKRRRLHNRRFYNRLRFYATLQEKRGGHHELRAATFTLTAFSKMANCLQYKVSNIWNCLENIMLSVYSADCHSDECHSAKSSAKCLFVKWHSTNCRSVEYHSVDWHYAKCHSAVCHSDVLSFCQVSFCQVSLCQVSFCQV